MTSFWIILILGISPYNLITKNVVIVSQKTGMEKDGVILVVSTNSMKDQNQLGQQGFLHFFWLFVLVIDYFILLLFYYFLNKSID